VLKSTKPLEITSITNLTNCRKLPKPVNRNDVDEGDFTARLPISNIGECGSFNDLINFTPGKMEKKSALGLHYFQEDGKFRPG
jgi:hypothetical protein